MNQKMSRQLMEQHREIRGLNPTWDAEQEKRERRRLYAAVFALIIIIAGSGGLYIGSSVSDGNAAYYKSQFVTTCKFVNLDQSMLEIYLHSPLERLDCERLASP